MSVIETERLSKSFEEKEAVAGVDLVVESGVVCALLGPSGCGKTTTLRLIAGFERPDGGRVMIGDRLVAGEGTFVAPEQRRIGMVFQDYALFPHMTVESNVAYALGRSPDAARVREVLLLVGLEELGDRHPHELSGGEQQRVALARAMAPTPEVILLDEPFSNLDAALRARVRREMRDILLAAEMTALFVTHDQEEALSLADRVAVMRDGRIEQEGTPEEIYGRPRTRWVADFLGDAEIVPGIAGGGAVECELGRFPIPKELEGTVDVLVRPESVALGAGHAPGRDRSQEGVVVAREYYGHDQLVEVELASGRHLRSRSMGFPIWHPGDRVRVWIDGPVNALAAPPASVPEPLPPTAEYGAGMKLYVCWGTFGNAPRPGGHPCGTAYHALKAAGHDPEVVKSYGWTILPSVMNSSRGRKEVKELTGKETVPVLVTDEGDVITESRVIADWAKAHPAT